MRTAFVSLSLAIVATIVAAVVEACGIYGALPATLQPGIVTGDQFVCVTTAGQLVVRDLKKNTHRDFTDLKPRFLSAVDVSANRACVATEEHVYVVDLATGKVLHTLPHAKGPVNVGFADKGRVFAAGPQAVEIFDLAAGKLQHRVELRKPQPAEKAAEAGAGKTEAQPAGKRTARRSAHRVYARAWQTEGIVPCCRHEDLLFVALPTDDKNRGIDLTTLASVAVIDLRQGRVTDEAKIASGITGLSTADGRLLVRSGILSYGVPLESCQSFAIRDGKIDAKAKDVRRYCASDYLSEGTGVTAFVDRGDQIVANGRTISRFDAHGKCLASKEALAPGRELVGVWNGQALIAEAGELHAVALTPVEPKPAAAE